MTEQIGMTTAASLLLAAAVNVLALISQAADGASAETVQQLIPAAALTGTSGALVWVVKQIVSGNLVHRDPASDATKNREALEAATRAIEASTRAIDRLTTERDRDDR